MNPSNPILNAEDFARAQALVQEINNRGGDLTPAFNALEVGMAEFARSGVPLDALLPADNDQGLGAATTVDRNAESFWLRYRRAVKRSLCEKNGELGKAVRPVFASGAGAVATAIMITLALPAAAITIVVPIAAILVSIGLDAFCEGPEPTETQRRGSRTNKSSVTKR